MRPFRFLKYFFKPKNRGVFKTHFYSPAFNRIIQYVVATRRREGIEITWSGPYEPVRERICIQIVGKSRRRPTLLEPIDESRSYRNPNCLP